MSERPLLDRMRLVRAVREPSGRILLSDASSGEPLALDRHYTEPGWVQLLLQAEGQLEGELREVTFYFVPSHDRPRF
jgi:hypothetical protein